MKQSPKILTLLEMSQQQQAFAIRFAKRIGLHGQAVYTSDCDRPGIHIHAGNKGGREGTVVLTQEFGFMFVADLQDWNLYDLIGDLQQVQGKNLY